MKIGTVDEILAEGERDAGLESIFLSMTEDEALTE